MSLHKIKVADATGPTLDWMVAKCEGIARELDHGLFTEYLNPNVTGAKASLLPFPKCFSPSTRWAQGGPIIERENISLVSPSTLLTAFWQADIGHANKFTQWDHKPLIAAMRCYVASKLGDEVEVPEGLS
jgi:Protein of unknown function (DUF2591)